MVAEGSKIDLRGQVALVTGGGRGLGRELALGLARAGAAVGALARTTAEVEETVELIVREDGRALALTADVTDLAAMERAVAETERQFGPIDLMVSNAGQSRNVGALWHLDPEGWWREIEVNLRGPYNCARSVLPGMLERRRGRIVIIASSAGLGATPGASAYCSSKAAAIRLADCLATEVREFGVGVFAVQPGFLKTSLNDRGYQLVEGYLADTGRRLQSDAVRSLYAASVQGYARAQLPPFERSVEMILFLASGRADALTGCFLNVRDDLEDLVRRAEEIGRDDLYKMRLRK